MGAAYSGLHSPIIFYDQRYKCEIKKSEVKIFEKKGGS